MAAETQFTIVRKADLLDAQPLSLLAESTFRESFTGVNTPGDMTLHCRNSYGEAIQAKEISDPDKVTLLCERDATLVGFAQLRWHDAPECVAANSPGEIQRLYVSGDCHGKGVAQLLMQACIDGMRDHQSDVVWLGVWENNPRAMAFYRKFGFVEVGEKRFLLGSDLQRDIVMARPVSA